PRRGRLSRLSDWSVRPRGVKQAMNATFVIASYPGPRGNAGRRSRSNFIAFVKFPGYVLGCVRCRGRGGFGRHPVTAVSKRAKMNRLLSWVAGVTAAAIMVIGSSVDASAERRVALVVGNANYKTANISLSNPRNDAQDISSVLTTIGFEVVT